MFSSRDFSISALCTDCILNVIFKANVYAIAGITGYVFTFLM